LADLAQKKGRHSEQGSKDRLNEKPLPQRLRENVFAEFTEKLKMDESLQAKQWKK
jgi:hypothetical protein